MNQELLQSLAEPVNQTSFARAIRLGTMSVLDATATVGQERRDHIEMATRWFHGASRMTMEDNAEEQQILDGLRTMLRAFNLYL